MRFTVALGTSAFKTRIRHKRFSIAELFELLTVPELRNKKDGKHFTLVKYAGNKRDSSTIKQYCGAAVDLDDTTLTPEEIQETFKDFPHVIYTTFSHQMKDKGNRYRLVIPYSEPIPPQKHVQTILALMHKLGGAKNVDLSSKALGRLMYLPSCRSNRKHLFETYVIKPSKNNRFFDPYKDAELTPEEEWEVQELAQIDKPEFNVNDILQDGNRNEGLTRFVGKSIKVGLDIDTALASAKAWNETNCNPPLSNSDVKTIVKSVYQTHSRKNGDSDWGFDEVKRRIKDAKELDYDATVQLITKSKKNITAGKRDLLVRLAASKLQVSRKDFKADLIAYMQEDNLDKEEELIESKQLTAQQLRKEFENHVYISMEDKVFNSKTGITVKPDAFNREHAPFTDKGSLLQILLQNKCIKVAHAKQFSPNAPLVFLEEGITYVNTYVPLDLEPVNGNVGRFKRHMKYLIPNELERNTLLDWLAYNIQNPGKKVRWMPIIKGKKGIGKSIISDLILTPMLGMRNVKPCNSKVLQTSFNGWQTDAQLVIFHELKTGITRKERQHTTDTLKEFITDRYIQIHRKGIDAYPVQNKCNALGFTNHDDSVIISKDERRFSIIKTDVQPRHSAYYKRLAEWLETNTAEMLYYFLNRDLYNFNPDQALETQATRDLKNESMLWPDNIIEMMLNDPKAAITKDGCTTTHNIIEYIKLNSSDRDFLTAESFHKKGSSKIYMFNAALKTAEISRYEGGQNRGRVYFDGERVNVYIHPNRTDLQMSRSVSTTIKNQPKLTEFSDA